jgi:hypothetical protein
MATNRLMRSDAGKAFDIPRDVEPISPELQKNVGCYSSSVIWHPDSTVQSALSTGVRAIPGASPFQVNDRAVVTCGLWYWTLVVWSSQGKKENIGGVEGHIGCDHQSTSKVPKAGFNCSLAQ